MKRLTVSAVVGLLVIASISCKKIIKALFPGMDVDVPAITVSLPPVPITTIAEYQLASFTQNFNLDSSVRANTNGTFNGNDVRSVTIKKIEFNVSNADQLNNLSNFESVRFTFSSNSNTEPVSIAEITFPNQYLDSYTYVPSNPAELRPYLNGSQVYYKVYGQMRKPTSKSLGLSVRVTLRVK